ncbi:hypothetical protein J7E73_13360 [Paenibacillus albidus]|uniref:hypothetical protein n=1 Tax=Paenibacillus albidus TaxID=2041023 RepID=UPI001BE80ED2|nr:hypothetical protein [Paenibacillus albidus]MBT2290115.1 hypothetical protein [Paenibacillus albidus]
MTNFNFFSKMKKTLVVVPLVLLSAFPGLTNAESTSPLELAKESVSNYVDAVHSGDVTEAVKWVVDTRFSSEQDQLKQYKESLTTDPFSNASIESIVPESDSTFIATLDLTRKENGETTKISLPVIEHDGTWKLFLNGQETMGAAAQKLSNTNNNKSIIAPLASTLLGSYGDSTVSQGSSIYSNQFNMTETTLGLTGWQQVPGVSSESTMRYSVVYKGFFSDDTIGFPSLSLNAFGSSLSDCR